jgi:hypothetical protein
MANYAVIDNGTVINTIVAESQEIAAEITGLTVLEYTEENPLGINWYWDATADAYITPAPYASWVYNYTAKIWEAPTPMPTPEEGQSYNWNEATTSWDLVSLEA